MLPFHLNFKKFRKPSCKSTEKYVSLRSILHLQFPLRKCSFRRNKTSILKCTQEIYWFNFFKFTIDRWPPFFLGIRNIELRNWSDDGSLTFTISFLNNSWICWSIIRLSPDSYLIEEDLTPDAVSHSQYLEWLCCFLSLTSFQEKSLAALVLELCADLLEKSHFYYWMYIYGNLWTENLYSFFRRLV